MIRVPGMLMVGAAGRNAGKTELACSLIRKFNSVREITGVKVTAIWEKDGSCPRGGTGCGVCSSLEGDYCITEETGGSPGKDTSRLLAAGARRVFWMRVLRSHLEEGLAALLERIGPHAVSVCESNSLRLVAEPDLFLMAREAGSDGYKQSARGVKEHVDRTVLFDGKGFDLDLDDTGLVGGRWALREAATAVILAGGGSSRMGRDKGMLPVGGRPMIEYVYNRIEPHFKEVLVSTAEPGKYAFLGARVVPDEAPGQGPLMGIASALAAAAHELVVVVACDIPEFDIALLRRMLRMAEGYDGVVPRTGELRFEPLFAVYRKGVLGPAREALSSGKRRVSAMFGPCRIRFVDWDPPEGLCNINTVGDYEELAKRHDDTA